MFTAVTYPILKVGSQGLGVVDLQRLINLRVPSFLQIEVNGIYDIKTAALVSVIQYQFLLPQTGITDGLTWKSLLAGAPVDRPILRRNATGEDVAIVQEVLQRIGYYKGEISGIFNRKTQTAVLAFQISRNFYADGIISDRIWAALSDIATLLTVD
jgi:peptidoglycan hydrolase-like protein with peptidoglycan-binding domain